MSESLFPDLPEPEPVPRAKPRPSAVRRSSSVAASPASADEQSLAGQLPERLHLGTSSWHYPGWAGLVWDGDYDERMLSREGLPAYASHPLLTTVCIDRSFYRPLTTAQYAKYAAQVPAGFRFVVKAPSLVTDAQIRDEQGRARQSNPTFLNPELARTAFAEPALEGLGEKLGALVFELSPLPGLLLTNTQELMARLAAMLDALPNLAPVAPDAVIAVEVRDPTLLTPVLAKTLREARATYCLGLHAKMPPITEQLPMLRALWPGPLVCRWNLNRLHGAYGYEKAQRLYAPYDQLHDPDPDTRAVLARVATATTRAGFPAYVTVSNKAEGCAPLTVLEFARQCGRS